MRHGSLFSGIGGFDLAATWMGWENIFHCEWNEFGQKILKYYWPNAKCYGDITKTDFTIWRGKIDIISGGFPCQPYSISGKREGTNDIRHLWPEMLRAIKEVQPRWIVGENVPGIINWKGGVVLQEIKIGLEDAGYKVIPPIILPAGGIGGRHKRERFFLVAHSNSQRYKRKQQQLSEKQKPLEVPAKTLVARSFWDNSQDELPKPYVIGRNNGIPVKLDNIAFSKWREGSISGFGNAVVPAIAFEIFKAIQAMENLNNPQ